VADPQGLHEDRTRITCHLPLNNEAEHRAVDAIFTYLQALRRQPLGVKGFTHIAPRPAAPQRHRARVATGLLQKGWPGRGANDFGAGGGVPCLTVE
jgi:hypothetical protein